ncbi:hypothetical protein JCM10213_008879 [Rhodosporidiobolus nylandii]
MPRATKSTEADEPLSRTALKSAVWYTVTKIAQEEELSLPFAASEHFVASLSEIVFQQALSLGKDLERFSKHAGRMTINVDDVNLAARRNEPLYEQICTAATQHGLSLSDLKADQSKPKKAARAASTSTAAKKTVSSKSSSSKTTGAASKKGKDKDDGAGGFVKASSLKEKEKKSAKGKGKARAADLESDVEDDGLDFDGEDGFDGLDVDAVSEAGSGSGESDSSEEVGKKRKGKKDAGGGGKAKKRRSEG